ncbi:MAG: type II secretion system F family protein [Phaeobacter italicus]|jgi:tight adherence protein C|uniref:Flp pilus assembly protein TadB n=1 Tax=Phaeobacter italicus TaxID=481446 RepID=A0A0H5CZL7_9RHOB|nr:type II secretion system F family protein [Phaeobacter italicus]EEB70283.1 type II/IV secretion system protein, TadC subfamily [Ruegeria sp. R11]MEC8015028.1 type II secretion system F family protein [Pseudomonadota bacterium]MBO9442021.1 type II secretion system F family protein [Phaeobacter italicus]MBY5976255.1 type II secretion system F family protein [Phaeobacter italicus]MCA0857177.1 type II secretion system F family protein [Phaeobacter italicus]
MTSLNDINDLLINQFGPFGPLLAVGLLGLFMILLAIPLLLNQPEDPMKKLQRSMSESTRDKKPQKERLRQADRNEQLQKFASFLEPQNADELSAMELKLRQAGYQSKDSVRLFHFAQFALGLVGLVAGLVYVYVLNADMEYDSQQMIIRIIGPGAAAYMLPKYWITRRIEERKQEITSGFPDALDMMLVCVEAGQSLDQAIVRVAKELHASYPALAEEFEVVAYEMKAGKEKDKVLRDMGTRCGVQDVSSFVTVMIQSATFGTSIADALRVYAGEMRDKRVMRAEEAANKLPTKMTLATMTLTVPPLLIILVGPSAQGIANLGNMSK